MTERRRWRRWWAPVVVAAAGGLILAAGVALGVRGPGHDGAPATAVACVGADALDFGCHEAQARRLVEEDGVDAAFAQLRADYAALGLVRAGCHELTHAIGRAAARNGDLPDAYAAGDPFCSAGYFHGAAEEMVAGLGAAALADPDALCADLGGAPRHGIVHRNCAHGLGHGFMHVHANDVSQALGGCDALADDWERESCYGGVFMERTSAGVAAPDDPAVALDREHPLALCDAIADRYRNMCYAKQAAFALYVADGDFATVFGLCAAVEEAFRPACEEGLGSTATVRAAKYVIGDAYRARFVREVCLLGNDESSRANCVVGAVRAIVNYEQADSGPLAALCAAFDGGLAATCRSAAEDKRAWPD